MRLSKARAQAVVAAVEELAGDGVVLDSVSLVAHGWCGEIVARQCHSHLLIPPTAFGLIDVSFRSTRNSIWPVFALFLLDQALGAPGRVLHPKTPATDESRYISLRTTARAATPLARDWALLCTFTLEYSVRSHLMLEMIITIDL